MHCRAEPESQASIPSQVPSPSHCGRGFLGSLPQAESESAIRLPITDSERLELLY